MRKVRVTLPNKRKVRVSIPSRKVRVSLPKAQVGMEWEMAAEAGRSLQEILEDQEEAEPLKLDMTDFPVIAPEGTDNSAIRTTSITDLPLEKIQTPKPPLLETPDPEPTVKDPEIVPGVDKSLKKGVLKDKARKAIDKTTGPLAGFVSTASMLGNALTKIEAKQTEIDQTAYSPADLHYGKDSGNKDVQTGLEGDIIAGVDLPSGYDSYRQGFSSQMALSKRGGEIEVDSRTIAKLIAAGANIEIL